MRWGSPRTQRGSRDTNQETTAVGAALEVEEELRLPFRMWNGTFDITVDWTHSFNQLEVSVVTTRWTGGMYSDWLLAASTDSSKPKRIRISDFAGTQDPRLVILNHGPERESISFQIVLTPR